jgi:hypothetical protein
MELVAKLQLKPGQGIAATLAPESVMAALGPALTATVDGSRALLAFVLDKATLERQRGDIVVAVNDERLTWVAYPKGGQLGTDLNRDVLVGLFDRSGIEPVRQIAIDDVWSALRLRPAR